jgi:hypothetical protein
MTMPRTMRRRTFLLGATGLSLSLVWRSLGFWPALQASPSVTERLAGLLNHEESARTVGRAYLGMVPEETSTDVLTARLIERLPGGLRTLEAADDGRLRELLRRGIDEDFQELRIVVLHGWVFARIEARLCALAALRGQRVARGARRAARVA